ncbi:MAG: glucosaminidase domain-containing protein [Bacteroidetes bacterium]|nr:glucosaminidase domain-containing protein [Bacteroidota bacterium]
MRLKILFTFLCATCITLTGLAQTISADAADYINQFKNIAMQEQIRTGVPAAIKLGQAILESQTGKSRLATEANNHFGIKCKTEWTGPKIYHNDDATGECFRVYDNAEASFIDHSNFLKTRTHYAFLFKLDVTDFTSWAFGLKQAGYATNPNYPAQLIKAINDYDLAQYTLIAMEQKKKGIDFVVTPAKQIEPNKMAPATTVSTPTPTAPAPVSLLENTKVTINHTKAVLATKGSSLLAIANSNKISLSKLFDFNELTEMNILDQDRILFIEKKQKYGASEMHVTVGAETLYSIAQKEGVLLSSLLTLNPGINKDSVLQVGQKIELRAAEKTSTKKTKKGKKK